MMARRLILLQLLHILGVALLADASASKVSSSKLQGSVLSSINPLTTQRQPFKQQNLSNLGDRIADFKNHLNKSISNSTGSGNSCHDVIIERAFSITKEPISKSAVAQNGLGASTPDANLVTSERHPLRVPRPPPTAMWGSKIYPDFGRPIVVRTTADLVQAIQALHQYIIVANNLNLTDHTPLPRIIYNVKIVGVCEPKLCILDADGRGNIFMVGVGGILILQNLDLRNGRCDVGGAVVVSGMGSTAGQPGGIFFAKNVHFFKNVASDSGGAVAVLGGALAYYHACIFISNGAQKGGAIYIGSSVVDIPSKDLHTLSNSSKSGKQSHTSSESPHHKDNHPLKWTSQADVVPGCSMTSCSSAADSLFYNNSANNGGAIYVAATAQGCANNKPGGKFDVMNSRFEYNVAGSGGGAILLESDAGGAAAQVQNSEFLNNDAYNHNATDILLNSGIGANLSVFYSLFNRLPDVPVGYVIVGENGSASFTEVTFSNPLLDSVYCLNTSSCNYCPISVPSAADWMIAKENTPAQIHGSVRGRPAFSVPWSANLPQECVVPSANLCGWMPSECTEPLGT